MKTILVLFLLLLATLAHSQQAADFSKVEWLIGTWNRTHVTKPGKTSHERWIKTGENELNGFGVTMQGADTTFLERITILVKDNTLYYAADVHENKSLVYFKVVEISSTGFVCENPEHDFPKKISYQVEGAKLKAQISGNGKAIDYYFERKQ